MSLLAVNLASFTPSDEDFASYLSLLDDASQSRIRRFRRAEDALRCLVGRLLPLYLLSTLEDVPTSSPITFQTGSHGRPSFARSLSRALSFRRELTSLSLCPLQSSPLLSPTLDYNVSHDGDWVALSWSRGEAAAVGVDVMRLGLPKGMKDATELVEALGDQLSPSERLALYRVASDDERTRLLLRLWMHKEAVAKLLGTGSAEDFSTMSFELGKLASSTKRRLVDAGECLATTRKREELEGVRFWEGRLGDGEEYGVVVARRDGEGVSLEEVRFVKVEEVAGGARRARAGSA